jgi:hypothetical protein
MLLHIIVTATTGNQEGLERASGFRRREFLLLPVGEEKRTKGRNGEEEWQKALHELALFVPNQPILSVQHVPCLILKHPETQELLRDIRNRDENPKGASHAAIS